MKEIEVIQNMIYEVRTQRVMLDSDLARLYGVETRVLNQAVKRNAARFEGDDFMFRLTKDEAMMIRSRSQIVILNKKRGSNIKYLPFAFTELGVAMLSSVLKSEAAININRDIMRAFVLMKRMIMTPIPDSNIELRREIEALRQEMNDILADQNDINEETRMQLDAISKSLAELQSINRQPKPRQPIIGFYIPKKK